MNKDQQAQASQASAQQPQEPFISGDQRPDLTIDMNQRVGDMTVRDLAGILGTGTAQKQKEAFLEKLPFKEAFKEQKDGKDRKDNKEHKEPKDHKDQKDNKDHKDTKDQKDNKDTKDNKDPKEQKDTKDNKDHKDPKEQKDTKDHKDRKEHKDQKEHKDHKDIKDNALEKLPQKETLPEKLQQLEVLTKDPKENVETPGNIPPEGDPAILSNTLQDLIQRVSGLEQQIQQLGGSTG